MIDGTLIVLLLALGLSALGRHLYRRGWHAGRAALLREQDAALLPAMDGADATWSSAGLRPGARVTWLIEPRPDGGDITILFDQEADA